MDNKKKLDYILLGAVPAALFIYGYLEVVRGYAPAASGGPTRLLIVYALFCLIYLPITWVMLRNVRLHGFLRYLFCLMLVPVFIVIFAATVLNASNFLPGLSEAYLGVQGSPAGMLMAAALTIPAAVVCSLWYWLLVRVDRRFILGKRES